MIPGSDVISSLKSRAERYPNDQAFVFSERSLSFAEVERLSNEYASGFKGLGIGRGCRTVMMVRPGPEFFLIGFALLKIGAILVLIDPGMGWKNLKQCLAEAEPEGFVGIPKAHIGRIVFGWAKATLRHKVCVGGPAFLFGTSFRKIARIGARLPQPDLEPLSQSDSAALVFTSGSTGVPKGVVYTHDLFAAQIELFQRGFGIQPGEADLATFAPFAFLDPGLGMTAVIPKMDFTRPGKVNPRNILAAIEKNKVRHLFASPALLTRVTEHLEARGIIIPHVKRILSAGAPVSPKLLERLATHVQEDTRILTPYGATEALPITVIDAQEILKETQFGTKAGKGVCVGRALEGVEITIIRITDLPLPEWSGDLLENPGTVGEIVVWGRNVSKEYYGRPSANLIHKIHRKGGEVGHRTGDVGYMDTIGRLWFCGRKSHRVITAKGPLFSVCCEGIFDQHPDVSRSALVGVGKNGSNQIPILCIEATTTHGKRKDRRIFRDELLAVGEGYEMTREIKTILFHKSFPVDIRHNAKIRREQLAQWASGKLFKKHW